MIGKKNIIIRYKKPSDMEISMLCHQMAVVFKSGVTPIEGLPLIADDVSGSDIKSSLNLITAKVTNGMPMYQAFSEFRIYPKYMLHMIEIGEKTGMLDSVMENLSTYYETEAEINKRIKQAVYYPAALSILMLGVISLLIIKIIPMFGEILRSLGGQLPKEAEILFSFATNMKTIMICFIAFAILSIAGFITLLKIPEGRAYYDRFKVNNPIFGSIYRKIIASRLGYGLSLTIQSGMNLMDGLKSLNGLIENKYVNKKIDEASEKISQGVSFVDAVKEMNLFPDLFVSMIRTGERSGNMDEMIKKMAAVYSKETELSLKKFSSTIEPVLVTILSVILGAVLLAVLLPLIRVMSSIG